MKCFDCGWFDYVGNMFCQYCIENNYMLYTTKEDKEFCDMLCGDVERRGIIMKEKIYLIEDTHADYNRLFMNKANSKKEALDKFWRDWNIDEQNKKDKKAEYSPRTKKQFRVTDVTQELEDCTIALDY